MFSAAKIFGLSAILSVAIVTAYELPQAGAISPIGQKYADRVLPSAGEPMVEIAAFTPTPVGPAAQTEGGGKGDSLRAKADDRCAAQTWPKISSECLVATNGTTARKAARTITFEERTGPNTSTLVRRTAAQVAGRRAAAPIRVDNRPLAAPMQPNQTPAVVEKARSHGYRAASAFRNV